MSLFEVFLELFKPIFASFSDEELLRCPKRKFHGTESADSAAASVVLSLNGGSTRYADLMEDMGTPAADMAFKMYEKIRLE